MELKVDITVIILTYDEEVHIERCIKNIIDWANEVVVMDSFSKDKTVEIAERLGAKVFYREFDNYANQRNYALKELPIENEWVFFLDADEYLTETLKAEIRETLKYSSYEGYYIKRRFYFWGKWIKHGGYYPTWILRLFKRDKCYVDRAINEHFNVEGNIGYLKNDFVDDNIKGINEWIIKHNKYASLEAEELANFRNSKTSDLNNDFAKYWSSQAQRKRWIREKVWNPLLPPLVRPFIYFFYRYIIRLGFLDGKQGLIYHFLQGLWFQFIIDVKYLEMKLESKDKS